ncbi:unnamed protein product [Prunus brigantina]
MEEAKAAAYYDELTRCGEEAIRFKQGLGFSSASTDLENPLRAVQRCLIRRLPSSASSSRPLAQKRSRSSKSKPKSSGMEREREREREREMGAGRDGGE